MTKSKKRVYDKHRYLRIKSPPKVYGSILESITNEEFYYIAGLIDGEGCFGIIFNKSNKKYIPTFNFSMTHRKTIEWIASKLGLKIYNVRRKCFQPHWKTQFYIKAQGKFVVCLCDRLVPLLITKKNQANLILLFGKTYIKQKGPNGKVPNHIMKRRMKLKIEMHSLNGNPNWTDSSLKFFDPTTGLPRT
jgi:hypothetical protein